MEIYSYSEARQKLSSLLDEAEARGKVFIRRGDGRTYALVPERTPASPLDVPSCQREHLCAGDCHPRQAGAWQAKKAETAWLTNGGEPWRIAVAAVAMSQGSE